MRKWFRFIIYSRDTLVLRINAPFTCLPRPLQRLNGAYILLTSLFRLSSVLILLPLLAMADSAQQQCPQWLNQQQPKLHSSKTLDLCAISANKVVLIVNTASQCGYTPQFKELEALYQQYKDRGFTIIGFPSDSFFQEHDEAEKTATVCYENYGVSFPMVASSKGRGSAANPIFQHIDEVSSTPKWNFFKYLIDRDGKVVDYYISSTKPSSDKITEAIEALLTPTENKTVMQTP